MFRFCYAFSQNPFLSPAVFLLTFRFALLLFKTVFVLLDLLLLAKISCAPAQTFVLALSCH